MKRWLFCVALLAAAFCVLTVGDEARAMDVDAADYVRLHVIAEDDSEDAQTLKLKVRDACLTCARVLLADCPDADEAWNRVNAHIDMLETVARDCARAQGYSGSVAAQTGVFEFPDREYGGVIVPAGEYRALRIVIVSGEGCNWWCVLYPGLCMPEDYQPGQRVYFYSSILQWIHSALGGGRS